MLSCWKPGGSDSDRCQHEACSRPSSVGTAVQTAQTGAHPTHCPGPLQRSRPLCHVPTNTQGLLHSLGWTWATDTLRWPRCTLKYGAGTGGTRATQACLTTGLSHSSVAARQGQDAHALLWCWGRPSMHGLSLLVQSGQEAAAQASAGRRRSKAIRVTVAATLEGTRARPLLLGRWHAPRWTFKQR